MSQKIRPITNTTSKTPTHTPALKISAIAWQLLVVVIMNNKKANNIALFFFILFILSFY